METPTLRTTRLNLRPITPADIPFILKLFSRGETNLYSAYADIKTLTEAEGMYETYLKPGFPTHFRVVAELRETGEPVGTIGLYSYSEGNRRAEMGYDLLSEHWGGGLMTEAVEEVLRYGFEELNLNRVEATTEPENAASVRVLERAGFALEGRLRERHIYKGGAHDELFFGLLASDWRRRHQANR
ncbi:MAG: GNAT family protein [Candidatus Bathyarchaeota archaeon]|nr:GNAT family protein [Candidatus Bathyarchaeota archaeon]